MTRNALIKTNKNRQPRKEDKLQLSSCYFKCLDMAVKMGFRSLVGFIFYILTNDHYLRLFLVFQRVFMDILPNKLLF